MTTFAPTDADTLAFFQKGLADGQYDHLTKSDYHELLETFAREYQSPNETFAQAYTRTIEKTESGKAIFKAYKAAPNTAPGRVEKHAYIAEIQKRADERFPEISTLQRRFAHAIDVDVHRRPYNKVAHAIYRQRKPPQDTRPRRLRPRPSPISIRPLRSKRARLMPACTPSRSTICARAVILTRKRTVMFTERPKTRRFATRSKPNILPRPFAASAIRS